MIRRLHYTCSFFNMIVAPCLIVAGLFMELSQATSFDPFLLFIYVPLLLVFIKNYLGFRLHSELRNMSPYPRRKEIVFYVLWTINVMVTLVLAVVLIISAGTVDDLETANPELMTGLYVLVWICFFTSAITLAYDIPLARKLARQPDLSHELLKRQDELN